MATRTKANDAQINPGFPTRQSRDCRNEWCRTVIARPRIQILLPTYPRRTGSLGTCPRLLQSNRELRKGTETCLTGQNSCVPVASNTPNQGGTCPAGTSSPDVRCAGRMTKECTCQSH